MAASACLEVPSQPSAPDAAGLRGWRTVSAGSDIIPPLTDAQMAYHAGEQAMFLYGGRLTPVTGGTAAMFRWQGGEWSRVCDPCGPGIRATGHGFVYDPDQDRLLLFGGLDDSGNVLADVWQWKSDAWTLLAPLPAARAGTFAIHDLLLHRVVAYGGQDQDFDPTAGFLTLDTSDITSEFVIFDPAAPSILEPGPRISQSSAAPGWDGHLYIYSESYTAAGLDDLWHWDGVWQRLCESCTGTARTHAALAVDPVTRSLLVVGGYAGGQGLGGTHVIGENGIPLGEDPAPSVRDSAAIASDTDRGVVVLYGGNGTWCAGMCGDTLEWGALP